MKLDGFIFAQSIIELLSKRTVMSGPFKGMRYPKWQSRGNALHAKYLGIYENELKPIWNEISHLSVGKVIDVGAAEGYLVVGCARMFPKAKVIAYEMENDDRKAIMDLAQYNGVAERIDCLGFCDSATLKNSLAAEGQETLVIMDIEGGEKDLLDPVAIPKLQQAYILVETHDFKISGCKEVIISRFQATHNISEVLSRSRVAEDFPFHVPGLVTKYFTDASSDFRSGNQSWLYLVPKQKT